MDIKKCDSCDFVGAVFSPFDEQKYGCYCPACLDGMEGDIAEREEYDSLGEDW